MDNSVTVALQTVNSTLTSSINPVAIVSIIGIVLGSCIALYLTWFGIRKITKISKSSLSGNLDLDENSIKARKWYKREGYKYYSSYDEYRMVYNSKYGPDSGYIS